MPSNVIVINGSEQWDIPDSNMPGLRAILKHYETSPPEPTDFSASREDECIWFRDNREGAITESHFVPEQAIEVAARLLSAAS